MRPRVLVPMLTGALVLTSAMIAVLAYQNRALARDFGEFRTQARLLHAGVFVPAVRLPTIDGDSVLLGESPAGAPQVLFLFTTTCPYCRASLPHWRELAVAAREAGAEVHGVALDGAVPARAYRVEHELDFPITSFQEPRERVLYRAWNVPQTIVLDPAGRVIHATHGVFDRAVARDSVVAAIRRVTSGRLAAEPGP